MTDIYTSTALAAQRSGRTTRMTEGTVQAEAWINYLKTVRDNTKRQRDLLTAHVEKFDALIDEESRRLNGAADPLPAPSAAPSSKPAPTMLDHPAPGPGPWPPKGGMPAANGTTAAVISGSHAAVPTASAPSGAYDPDASTGGEENGGASWPQ